MKSLLCFFSLLLLAISSSCKKNIENILIVQLISEPDGLHPVIGNSAIKTELNLYTHLSLLRINYKTSELGPCLAEALPVVSVDGLNYDYKLKNNITWDNGAPITASDVIFTVKANQCLNSNNFPATNFLKNIKEVIANPTDTREFTIIVKQPHVLNTWFWTDIPILQEAFYDGQKILSKYSSAQLTDSDFLNKNTEVKNWSDKFTSSAYFDDPKLMNGAGPYKITKWEKGIGLTLEKKESHWSDDCKKEWFCRAIPDKIFLKISRNETSALVELKNDSVDISTLLDYESFNGLLKDEKFKINHQLVLSETYNYNYVAMNMKPDGKSHKKLFTDLEVRKAMAMLTPYEKIRKASNITYGSRMTGPVSSNKSEFNQDLLPVNFDVETAKDLLEEAGWIDTDHDQIRDKMIDGEKVKMQFNINFIKGSMPWEIIARELSESMNKVGIYAMLNPLEYNSFIKAASTHDFDMLIGAWQGSIRPEDFSKLWYTYSWKHQGLNYSGFGTVESDALIDSINSCIIESARKVLSQRFQQMVYDEQPYIFLFTQTRRLVIHKKWDDPEIFAEYPGVLLNTLKLKD